MSEVKYGNATKDTWRGWAWNQITKRVPPGGRVLVFCGDGGFDFHYGLKRGFETIGVDFVDENVSTFRSHGGIAIGDSAKAQLILMKPDACILDFTAGCTIDNLALCMDSFFICKATVANFLRGREVGGLIPKLHAGVAELGIPEGQPKERRIVPVGKHRGRIAFWLTFYWWMIENVKQGNHRVEDLMFPLGRKKGIHAEGVQQLIAESRMYPQSYTYRSKNGGQYFDSIAWTNPSCQRRLTEQTADQSKLKEIVGKTSIRKAAAAKALLTMRKGCN